MILTWLNNIFNYRRLFEYMHELHEFDKLLKRPYPELDNLYPLFKEKIIDLLEEAKKAGLEVAVFQGYRPFEEQQELYNKGRKTPGQIVTNARPGRSWHNYGLAADIVFKPNGKWSWSNKHDWESLGKIGMDLGLEWGGNWRRIKDLPHFQWPKAFATTEALKIHKASGIDGVWREVSNASIAS